MRYNVLYGVILLLGSTVYSQPIRYSVANLGNTHYVVVQQELHSLNALDELIYLSTDEGTLSVVWQNHADAAYVRHFDDWGRPLHDAVRIDDPTIESNDWPLCGAYFEGMTTAFWRGASTEVFGGAWSSGGTELTAPFSFQPACCPESVTISESLIAVAESYPANGSNFDIAIHFFDTTGWPIGDDIMLAEPVRREQSPSIAFLSDSTLIIGYVRSDLNPNSRPKMVARRIEPDLTYGDFVELLPQDVQTKLVIRALPNDDFLAISDLRPVGSGGIAQRCDAYCQPTGDPIPLHANWLGAAANSSARIALGFEVLGIDWYLRVYEPDGTPIGAEWRPIIPPVSGILGLTWPRPVAFDDNGTIWVAWYQNGGFSRPIITMLKPFVPGDMNRDGLLNNFDIDPFVFALSNLPGYSAQYDIPEEAAVIIGDINEDGFLNNFDIDPFVMLLAEE